MKLKISAFEYAIMEAAGDPDLSKYSPRSRAEEQQHRHDNIMKQAAELKIITAPATDTGQK